METLTKLFGSITKVKVVKQFVFNPEVAFDASLMANRTKETVTKVRAEMSLLEKMDLIKRRVFFKTVYRKKNGQKIGVRVKANGWILNENFEFLRPLLAFLVSLNHLNPKDIVRKLNRGGAMKLIVMSGVFIQNTESRVDLLVVGDHIKKGVIDSAIKTIEAEIGKEIRYAVFETSDFKYRFGLYDKLVRDILEFPHEKILNKLGVV